MAKSSGLGASFFVGGYDLSGDTRELNAIRNPSGVIDVTGIDKSAYERIYGAFDGEISFTSYFNDEANQALAVLKAKQSGAVVHGAYYQGATIGNMVAALVARQVNYDFQRPADGSLQASVQLLGDGFGLDFGEMLTAGKRTDTGATNGASFDGGGATSLGLAAYLQVFAFTGTDITISLEESSDDGGGDAFAAVTGGGFTQVTSAPASERIVTSLSQAVEQYLRVVSATSGGFTSCQFAVAATRYPYQ